LERGAIVFNRFNWMNNLSVYIILSIPLIF